MARPRTAANRGLPQNLHLHAPSGLYRYKHPVTGKYHYLSRDRAECIAAAKKLNAMLLPSNDLVSRVVAPSLLFDKLIALYKENELAHRNLAEKTQTIYNHALRRLDEQFGQRDVTELTVRDLASGVDELTSGGRMRNQYRSLLIELFQYARAEGWREDNPADALRIAKTTRQRARFTWAGFVAVYRAAPPWLRVAMGIALYSLQREGDVLSFEYPRDGVWRFEQEKTGTPLEITIEGGLARAIERSRDDVVSPLVVHRLPEKARPRHMRAKKRTHHTQVLKDQLIREFAKVRRASGFYDGVANPPTFHEIRSLGAHLMSEAGHDETVIQLLLGHQDVEQTRVYLSDHKRSHVRVAAASF